MACFKFYFHSEFLGALLEERELVNLLNSSGYSLLSIVNFSSGNQYANFGKLPTQNNKTWGAPTVIGRLMWAFGRKFPWLIRHVLQFRRDDVCVIAVASSQPLESVLTYLHCSSLSKLLISGTGNANFDKPRLPKSSPSAVARQERSSVDAVRPDARPSLMRAAAALLLLSFPSKGGMCIKFGSKPN